MKRPLPDLLESKKISMIVNDVVEALNLLYVATTRAEEELYLYVTCPPPSRGEGTGRSYLSTWLKEMLVQGGWPVA